MPLTPPVPPAPALRELVRVAYEREISADALSAGGAAADRARFDTAARLTERVLVGMTAWFGNAGTHALACRALARVQQEQQLLTAMSLTSGQAGLRGLDTAADTDGALPTVEGILAFMGAFAEGLGQLVGTNLTARLFNECALPDDPSVTVPTTPLSPPRHTTDD